MVFDYSMTHNPLKFMWRKLLITMWLLALCAACDARTITIQPSLPLQQQFSKEGVTYKIKSSINLDGKEIIIPKDAKILFKKKGFISNGKLIGNNTRIKAKDRQIFDNVTIGGFWDTPVIYINWMNLSDKDSQQEVQELLKLQNPLVDNIIYTPNHPLYWTPKWDNYSLFNLENRSILFIRDTIYTNTNDRPFYRVVNVEGKDSVKIYGGVLIGDVETHTYSGATSHGWGFGVCIKGSSNIEVKGTTSMDFTGDGFYIGGEDENQFGVNENGCKNILITEVHSLYNRRQGMSVTGATDHLYVYDSEFSFTGKKRAALPGAGIDIEVNYDNQCIHDVCFKNCVLKGNKKGLCLLNKKGNGNLVFDNVVIDSEPEYNLKTSQYEVYPFHCVNISGDYESISFKNCKLGAIANMTTFNQELANVVTIDNCSLSIIYTRTISDSFLRSFKISNSTFDISNQVFYDRGLDDNESRKEIISLLYCASLVYFDIDNCKYITENTGIKSGFSDNECGARITIRNCVLDKEMIFPHYNASFYNCHIIYPTYRWIAIRKGMTCVWNNNNIEITEPSKQAITVTQIRGEGNPPFLVLNNNLFHGKINTPINKMTTIKDICELEFSNNHFYGTVLSEQYLNDMLRNDFSLKSNSPSED